MDNVTINYSDDKAITLYIRAKDSEY